MHGAGFTGSGEDHLASVVERRSHAPTAACACSPPAPRSARAPTRSSRRSPPKRSASTATNRDRAARYGGRAQQRPDRRVAHVHGRRQAGRDAALGAEADAVERGPACRSATTRAEFQRALPRLRRAASARCAASAQYQPPPGCTGTTRSIRAMRTALTRGPSTSPKCRSILTTCEDARRRFRRGAGSRAA